MPTGTKYRGGKGLAALIYVGGLGLVVAVFSGILAIDFRGDRQKQGQLLVSQIESRLSLVQNVPWDADPEAADLPPKQVRAALVAASRDIQADMRELGDIEPRLRDLAALERENARILERQLRAVAAGDEDKTNAIADEALVGFAELQRRLAIAARQFSESAANSRKFTFVSTAALLLALYAAFALTLSMLRRAQGQRAAQSERLRQSQKMEAVGQLAGGVAHDFNNLLTAISGYSELALSRLDESGDPDLRADIEEIARSGERAAELTKQLLALSRRQTLESTVFDLNEAVSGTESLLKRLLGSHISIETSLSPTACPIEADHGQIEQVLMNLALNSRYAMPDGGALRIETTVVRLTDEDTCRRFQAPTGEYVLLRVADTGSGMDETTRQRAFEPFFTTKPLGEGTGLGLATIYGIVSQTGGYIALQSEQGIGTTFELLLPRAAALASIDTPTLAPTRRGGSERILVVEDEAVVRELTRLLLSGEGYTVTVAADGEQALALAREHSFDLVITDMVMPNMSGTVLAQHLMNERPDRPIIFISGYAHDVSGGELRAGEGFLQKPYSRHDLSVAVRTSLDRSASRAA